MALLEIELPEALLPQPKQIGQFIRRTQSVCPECNRILPATVFAREGKVFMTKTCPEHGETEELYFGSYDMYQKFATYWSDGKGTHAPNVPIESCACPANCGLCSNHLSHTGLANIIVTNRCDLTCWYCFFYVKKGLEGAYVYEPSMDQVREMVRALKAERPVPGNSLQITGGEPTLRPELPEIVRIIKEEGVDHIQLNTNGINLALNPNLAHTLRDNGLSNLYMSFDGVSPKTNPKNHWEAPYTIKSCRKDNLGVVLVPTVIKSINDHELGGILRFAQRNIDIVRAISYQPVSLTGRMKKQEREKYRITIPDCIERIEEQTNGEIPRDAWFPVPSCSPVTHFVEAFTKQPAGLNLSKLLVGALLKHDYSSVGQFHIRSMFLGMMHFQDKYNQDEERLQRCDIHYLTPDMRIIPFCSFNVIPEWYRDRIQKKYGITVDEWEKKNGEKLEARLYRGSLRRGKHADGCGCSSVHIEPITGT